MTFRKIWGTSLLVFVLGLLLATAGWGQPRSRTNIKASFVPDRAAPGSTVQLRVKVGIQTGYHIYAMKQPPDAIPLPTSFTMDEMAGVTVKDFEEPGSIPHEDEFTGKYNYHEGEVVFSAPVVLGKDADGEIKVAGTMMSMACTWEACDPPASQKFTAVINVSADAPLVGQKEEKKKAAANSPFTGGISGGPSFGIPGPSKVELLARFEPSAAAPGSTVLFKLTAKVRDGYHIYGLTQPVGAVPEPTRIEFSEHGILAVDGKFGESKAKVKVDNDIGNYNYHEGEVIFEHLVSVPESADDGSIDVMGKITYMTCTWEACDQSKTEDFKATFNVSEVAGLVLAKLEFPEEESSRSDTEGTAKPVASTGEKDEEEGLLGLILLAVAAGFGALLTPCVFPMIPITVSFFTKQAEESGGKVFGLATAYALGIVVSFTGFGLLLAALKGATGAQEFAANPWINMFIAGIFIVFALSLFGLFEIRLPTGILNKLDKVGRGKTNILAVMFMGFTFTLAAFTCTMPFMGAVLAQAASGEALRPIVGMLAFSGAFAFPFFLLGLFPKLLTSLPRSGGWMHSVKVTMGFIELAAAFKFLSNADLIWDWQLLSREVVLAVWVGIFAFNGLYLLGFYRMKGEPPVEGLGALRMLFALFFVSITLYLATGFGSSSLGGFVDAYLPPARYPSSHVVGAQTGVVNPNDATKEGEILHADLRWMDDFDRALLLAKKTGKKVFVNFTGFT